MLRVVFNFADRRKVSKYAKVIEWADKKNLAVNKVARTIKSHKGIEAICSSKGKSKGTEDFTENAVQQLPKLKQIGKVAKSNVATYKTNELVFFVGVAQSDGSVKLVQTVDLTEAQAKPILSKIGKTLKDTKPENVLKMSSTKESSTQKAAAKAKKAA